MNVPALLGRAGRAMASAFDPSKLDLPAIRRERDRVLSRQAGLRPPITRVLPVARAIELGGGLRVASELRLADLAELQAWLEGRVPHPLEGMPPAWADPEPATRVARLAIAWEAAAGWPPRLGTGEASLLLGSAEGRAFTLWLVLRRCDRSFGLAAALDLLPRVTPAEWAALERVAWAITPRQEVAAELAPDRSPRPPSDWCRQLDAVTESRGLTYEQMGRLTISQYRNLCSGGVAEEFSPESAARSRRVRQALEAHRG